MLSVFTRKSVFDRQEAVVFLISDNSENFHDVFIGSVYLGYELQLKNGIFLNKTRAPYPEF